MTFPDFMTADDIAEFEYEYCRWLDIENGHGFWTVNAELQVISHQLSEVQHESI